MDFLPNLLLSSDRSLQFESDDDFVLEVKTSWKVINYIMGSISSLVFFCAVLVMYSILKTVMKRPPTSDATGSSSLSSTGRASSTNKAIMHSFNLYLLFIILPDTLLNGMAAVSQFWEATHEGRYTPTLCIIRNFSSFFHYFANVYLNAVVGREIYVLICNSHRRQKTDPPSLRKVFCQVCAVYVIMGLLVGWMLAEVYWSPTSIENINYCYTYIGSPTDLDKAPVFTPLTSTFLVAAIVGPPVLYVLWMGYVVYKRNLLPIKGRTRAIAIYFFRIVLVFLLFYIPNLTLAFIYVHIPTDEGDVRFWVLTVFQMMVPVQCVVTLRVALEKDDIYKSFRSIPSPLFSAVSTMLKLNRTSSQLAATSCTDSSTRGGEWEAEDVYSLNTTCSMKEDVSTSHLEVGMTSAAHKNEPFQSSTAEIANATTTVDDIRLSSGV